MLWSPLLLLAAGIQTAPEEPALSAIRNIRITDVSERPVASGIVKTYFAVEGTMPDGEKRIFYILYFGGNQRLPVMTNLCSFHGLQRFRQVAGTEGYAVPSPAVKAVMVDHFSCVDAPHDRVDEKPSGTLRSILG
jgi:hypothetical protein